METPSVESYRELPYLVCYNGKPRYPIMGYGLCECGCGEKTRVATKTVAKAGHIKGHPLSFIHGHHAQSTEPDYEVRDCGYKTPCWIWMKGRDKSGYGRTNNRARLVMATHVYWEHFRGEPLPEGLVPDHLCKNHPCVNPDHLEPVTTYENVHRGDSCTVTPEKARAIIEMRKTGALYKDIATEFSITKRHAMAICYGEHWFGHIDKADLPYKTTRTSYETIQEIIRLNEEVLSPMEIASRVGVPRHRVYSILSSKDILIKWKRVY